MRPADAPGRPWTLEGRQPQGQHPVPARQVPRPVAQDGDCRHRVGGAADAAAVSGASSRRAGRPWTRASRQAQRTVCSGVCAFGCTTGGPAAASDPLSFGLHASHPVLSFPIAGHHPSTILQLTMAHVSASRSLQFPSSRMGKQGKSSSVPARHRVHTARGRPNAQSRALASSQSVDSSGKPLRSTQSAAAG